MTPSELLINHRKAKGLTLLQVAKQVKATAQFIYLLETGKTKVPPKMILNLCKALGMYKGDLIDSMVKEYERYLKGQI